MNIGVFGSSSKSTNPRFVQESFRLGCLIAEAGYTCVNGAGCYGCMGGVNNGCLSKEGRIRGVIHEQFCIDNDENRLIKDLIIVKGSDLTERKDKLFDESDCFIIMPGGVGTYDELWEGICAQSLQMKNLTHKPFCLVNIDGFYDGFISQMHRAKADGLLYLDIEQYFHVTDDVEAALTWCVAKIKESKADKLLTKSGKTKLIEEENRLLTRTKEDRKTIREARKEVQLHEHAQYMMMAIGFITIGFLLGVTRK